mgnify:CR=1 FL=1
MISPLNVATINHARTKRRADGTSYQSLAHEDELELARAHGVPAKEVQIAALHNEIVPERYCRNQNSLSCNEQISLLTSRVAIIGQGGLGGMVTEILTRIGVGALTLVDGDSFEESNLNRQLLSTLDALGDNKAETGRIRAAAINPAVEVEAVTDFLTRENGHAILAGADLAVDCLDSITSRFILEDACRSLRIPLVSAAIGGTAGQALVIFPEDTGLRTIYGPPETSLNRGMETRLGTLPYTAVFMAAVECAETVSLLCRNSSVLRNTLFVADLEDKSFEKIPLP